MSKNVVNYAESFGAGDGTQTHGLRLGKDTTCNFPSYYGLCGFPIFSTNYKYLADFY